MRFFYGVIAMGLWVLFLEACSTHGAANFTDWQCILTCSIVAAGAMAGGA